ncbi:MAG: hypothetical protein ASUL_07729 [Candidatus Aramenus sulfurataquae]|uniref:Uncharacterized protein n=3 Tax=Candidatus Aramenus sulfurataquae TaxID=1326980 RepID=W7L5F1_9CREN|nr:MAG: hypothetical protein ASUL_07729 [Candidatus Aramenus sulfurataquae]MCL7344404.1 hypothetical protein [Candidatus Aramenus sulfurataquae]
MQDKEVVMKVVEDVGRWEVMLAGINGDEILMVKKGKCADKACVEGKEYKVKWFDPEDYLKRILEDEEVFRKYKVVYFVKAYLRKVLDVLASAEVQRMSMDLNKLDA